MTDFTGSGRGGSKFFMYLLVAAGAFIFITASLVVMVLKKAPAAHVVQTAAPVLEEKKEEAAVPLQMVEVIVPFKNISQSEPLQPSYFAKVARPASQLPQNLVRNYDDLKGKFARVPLNALEPVTFAQVSKEQPVNPLADSIPVGFRAVAITVNSTSSVEGWASLPGSQVDVHWITDVRGQKTDILLVQNCRVLSAERQIDPNAAAASKPIPGTITLLASERDAQKVSLAAAHGAIVLSLRGVNEIKGGRKNNITINQILEPDSEDGNKIHGVGKYTDAQGNEVQIAIIGGDIMKKVE